LIHSDVWGPSPIATKEGSRYYVFFIDDHTRYCWVYLMKHRSEFFEIYAAFRALIKTQHSAMIKCFRCDLSGEYTFNKFYQLLTLDETIHQTLCTDTPEQNGVAERKHRHIVETARSLLLSVFVPSESWGEAILTVVSLINTIPSSHSSGLSPFEKLYGYVPDYSSFRVFGCTCFVLHPHVERNKLSSRSAICVFLGYGEGKRRYRCFDPITQKLYVSRHVVFLKHIFFFSIPSTTHSLTKSDIIRIDPFSEDSGNDTFPHVRSICTHNSTGTDTLLSSTPEAPFSSTAPQASSEIVDPPPRQSIRIRKSTKLPKFAYSCYSSLFTSFLASIHCLFEPSSYKEAILNPFWQQVMHKKLSTLHKIDTWDLVPLPPGKSVVGCRWVYKIKTNSDGSIERYKARVVAKGYSQQYGMDYEETFASVAKMTIICTLIIVASIHQWHISQLDVKNAFLNGNLQEEVYMAPPLGISYDSGYVCKLKKALYGLKQAPCVWFEKFSTVISSLSFVSSNHDSALFIKCTDTVRIILSFYVEDMIITGDDTNSISVLKTELARRFEMKDLGYLRYFLSIEVAYSPRGYLPS